MRIPDQLVGIERFIKLEPESKEPTFSPEGPFFSADDDELAQWLQDGGNVGLNLGPLVAIDVDHDRFRRLVEDHLLPTFTVRSGGGGEHRYYRCEWSGRHQFTDDGTDMGSIRSGNWYVAVPPSVHPSGDRYRVLDDRPIQTVPVQQIEDLLSEVSDRFGTANTAAGGGATGGGGGCVGGSPVPSIPSEYPNREADWNHLKKWLKANDMTGSLNQTTSSDWSGLEFKIAKCLAEGGFSEAAISTVLDRLHHNAKWHQRGDDYRTRTVRNAIVAACEDDYVDFSTTGDMDALASESRKTESGEGNTGLKGGEQSMSATYNDKEEVTILEGSEDGDSFKKVVLVERVENGESVEYVAVKKGRIEEVELRSGESGLTERVTDSTSLGSPEYIEELADGLKELADKLNDN